MGIWDGIRRPDKPKPRGFLGIEHAVARHRWVRPFVIVAGLAVIVLAFMDACSQQL